MYSLAGILLLGTPLSYGKQAGKPLPPVQITIVPVQAGLAQEEIKPGDIIDLIITAESFAQTHEMRIEVNLTGGAKLVSGETSWKGSASKNEKKTITLTVQAPEKGKGIIRARVSLPPTGSTRFSSEAHFSLGPEIREKPAKKPVVKKDSKGRRIIEYR